MFYCGQCINVCRLLHFRKNYTKNCLPIKWSSLWKSHISHHQYVQQLAKRFLCLQYCDGGETVAALRKLGLIMYLIINLVQSNDYGRSTWILHRVKNAEITHDHVVFKCMDEYVEQFSRIYLNTSQHVNLRCLYGALTKTYFAENVLHVDPRKSLVLRYVLYCKKIWSSQTRTHGAWYACSDLVYDTRSCMDD